MIFQKQVQFSKHIKAGGRIKEFNFLKLNNTQTPTYSVDVSDERGKRFVFLLINDGSDWKISGEGLPEWLVSASPSLQQEIDSPHDIE
jgi:hypothetical protein